MVGVEEEKVGVCTPQFEGLLSLEDPLLDDGNDEPDPGNREAGNAEGFSVTACRGDVALRFGGADCCRGGGYGKGGNSHKG